MVLRCHPSATAAVGCHSGRLRQSGESELPNQWLLGFDAACFAVQLPGDDFGNTYVGTADTSNRAETVSIPLDPGWADIREGVRHICARFPNAYWVKLDHEAAYPTEFVDALTEAGYLGALIPEEYGGSGLPLSAACAVLETIHEQGCNAAACHAQMYTMGTVLRHGNAEQKRKYLPGIASGALRLQAFGVTEPTTGSDTTQLKTRADKKGNDRYDINGQKCGPAACCSPT